MQFNTISINVAIKISLDAKGLRSIVDNYFGGIGIPHKEYICTWREKGRFYDRETGTWICVGV